ncbi:phosphoenolpyruvate--protein phosphotransferase [Oceanispirochaeta crateris]|uniref:Phosphoenolpyruvate-protein phosphotransferase n=1 Tax=Oceanispirochaeta crateris TaxID=2518645 RepID=A0A5C1QPL4_9SPIO|nr:phosphoenolpyruvate--protein phosphotransferase [Oceanispirochaeta crateris]QEN08534.1 phosphoenolpyruvate--protein phosphotransferase [Oceanispirochaeta crateris]
MKEFHGISASPGIVISTAFLYNEDSFSIPCYSIKEEDIEGELTRYHKAIQEASEELTDLKKKITDEHSQEEARFLDSHILMLHDPMFKDQVFERLKKDLFNIEWVAQSVIQDYIQKLNASGDQYLRERSMDINDVSKRIINNLLMRKRISLADLSSEVIIVTPDLLPSDTLLMNKWLVKGIVMDAGGRTSHTAILARSFGIPAILGLRHITKEVADGDILIIDALKGIVYVNPDKETLLKYKKKKKEYLKRESELFNLSNLPSETRDGKLIHLKANIEVAEELDSVHAYNASGIGLFRTEFLVMQSGQEMDEELQYSAYIKVVKGMNGLPVTIRTLDVGGDKLINEIAQRDEKNPLLGWRAIRFCLERTDVFRIQLRAILRASAAGPVRIMFPMISGIEEFEKALKILKGVKRELRSEGIAFADEIPVGCMIEVPSAALTSDILARRADFFSIGTNDLIQYTIAVDRGNEKITSMYEPFHPAVLRLIKIVVDNAHDAGIPVGMCGEMAGDPMAAVILMGLGLDELSMSSFSIPEIKRIIRSTTILEAEEFLGTLMDMKSFKDIDHYVREWMEEKFEFITG